MVSVLDSGLGSPGLGLQVISVVFLGKTLYSHSIKVYKWVPVK